MTAAAVKPGSAAFARVVREILARLVTIEADRDDRIRELLGQGMPARRVAELLGVGMSRVLAVRRKPGRGDA